jgi:Amt family ammonium transporter
MERILVIDDEASICKALHMGLASEDFEVDFVYDGNSAIQLAQSKSYDILIADLCLPDLHGLEVIKRIKLSSQDIIPIVITGNGNMQSSLEAIRLEVSDYLQKPLSLHSLKESITRGIKRRDMKRRKIDTDLRQKLFTDSLTDLPDRSLFMDRLKKSIIKRERYNDRSFSVFLIDIDQFKKVNDVYGHEAGDKVLIELSGRLNDCIRATDTIARLNGDEFAVLFEDFECDKKLMEIAKRCHQAAAQPFLIDGHHIYLKVSIGIVSKTLLYDSPDDILRDAEIALSSCKQQGTGLVKIFEKELLEKELESLQLENDLLLASQRQEFVVYYQPIIRIIDERLEGFEALVRWNHPEFGMIYPATFISKAEELGLIRKIGAWIINEGCRQIKEWQRTIPGFKKISLNINLSCSQFFQPGFADMVAGIIHEHHLDPGILKFELTESVLMENTQSMLRILTLMKNIGIRLAIDDFGTGYSSFSYLQRIPLDDLKIGKSFIQEMERDKESYKIVEAIVTLAKKLGLNTVAEGVETEEHYNMVRELGFDMVQGFLFAKPADKLSVVKHIKRFL